MPKRKRNAEEEFFKLKKSITDHIVVRMLLLEEREKNTSTTLYVTPVQALDTAIKELEKLRSYIRNVMLYKK